MKKTSGCVVLGTMISVVFVLATLAMVVLLLLGGKRDKNWREK